MLIYNWKPEYTGRHESGKEEQDFQQTYIFDGVGKKDKQRGSRSNVRAAGSAAKGLLQKWFSWA